MKTIAWLAFSATLLLAGGLLAEDLPEKARVATQKGLAAVEQKEWPLAIKYFREAQEAAPKEPGVLFRLALAHDKAGHELPALAWYRAYLAAAPRAENAGTVRDRLIALDVAVESASRRVLKMAFQSLEALDPGKANLDNAKKDQLIPTFADLIELQVRSGDDGSQEEPGDGLVEGRRAAWLRGTDRRQGAGR